MFKKLVFYLFGFAFLSNTVLANTIDRGLLAYNRGEHSSAISYWLPLAQSGNVTAQFNLWILHYHNSGEIFDVDERLNWLQTAANNDDGMSLLKLGLIYSNKNGEYLNDVGAARWFLMAANKNILRTQILIVNNIC